MYGVLPCPKVRLAGRENDTLGMMNSPDIPTWRRPFHWSLLVAGLCIMATFLHVQERDLDLFFMSDTLYLPSIYRDVFQEGGRFADWSLNPAPNIFPDMGVYFFLNALFGDFRWAHYVFPIVQFVLIIVFFRCIVRRVAPGTSDASLALGVLLLALVILTGWWGNDFGFAFHLLVNSYHGGAFVNALLCTALLLWTYDRPRVLTWTLLVLATAASAVSDKLFWVMFTIPAALVGLLLALRSPVRGRWVALVLTIVASTVLAHRGMLWVEEALPLEFEEPYAYLAFHRVVFSWGRFLDMLRTYLGLHPLVAGTIVLGLGTMCVAMFIALRWLRIWWRTPRVAITAADDRLGLVVGMMGLFFPFVLFAPVLNGSFDGLDSLRYNFAVFALAPLVSGLMLGRWLATQARWPAWAGVLALGLPALLTCAVSGRADYARIGSYVPQVVRDFDELTRGWALRNGVANYWVAKRITMFSEQKVKVLPVLQEVSRYVHVNRPAMFDDTFEFIIVNDDELSKDVLVRVFQQDTGFHALGQVQVMRTPPWTFDPGTWRPTFLEQ